MFGSSIREGNGNPLQYSCLENPGREAERDTMHGVTELDITKRLSTISVTEQTQLHIHICIIYILFFSFLSIVGYYDIEYNSLCYMIYPCLFYI